MIGAITKKVTRSSTSASVQDENKATMGKSALLGDKKMTSLSAALPSMPPKRSAFGDISNVASNTSTAGAKAEKKPLMAAVLPSRALANKVPAAAVAATKPIEAKQDVLCRPVTRSVSSVSLAAQAVLKAEVPIAQKPAPIIENTHPLPSTMVSEAPSSRHIDPMMIDSDDEDEDCEDAEDIDIYDVTDPQCCTEYVMEIFSYCRKKEVQDAVAPTYMSKQADLNKEMRAILIDWMVEVNIKFKLLTETMFLSVNLVDRFLAAKVISRNKLQLVGITAMLLSSKYEEIYPIEVEDFIYISDQAYTRDEILRMERLMLATLNFNLSVPTPLHFLRRFSKAARSDSPTHTLSKYLTELTLPEYTMLRHLPSIISAAAVYLARRMSNKATHWNATLVKYTTYKEEDIIQCARELNAIVRKASTQATLKATYGKYKSDKLLAVAKVPAVADF